MALLPSGTLRQPHHQAGCRDLAGREEKHPEGNYYIACAGQWIPAGPDALNAQRQRHALLSGNSTEYERYSGRPVPKSAVVQLEQRVTDGRKKIKDEISKYLDDIVASKRPGKTVRMTRNEGNKFVTSFSDGKRPKPRNSNIA